MDEGIRFGRYGAASSSRELKPRNRISLAVAVIATIGAGLASRGYPDLLPSALGKYPGDALWAAMVFFAWGLALPKSSGRGLAAIALATSWLVEFSQLYQAPWINQIRGYALGRLALGSGFNGLDLLAYAVGVGLGIVVDALWLRRWSSGVS